MSTFIVITLLTWLGTQIGKRRAFFAAIGISMVGYALKWFCYDPDVPWLLLVPAPLMAFGLGGLFTLMGSMIADVVDEDELLTSERREGIGPRGIGDEGDGAGAVQSGAVATDAVVIPDPGRGEAGLGGVAAALGLLEAAHPGVREELAGPGVLRVGREGGLAQAHDLGEGEGAGRFEPIHLLPGGDQLGLLGHRGPAGERGHQRVLASAGCLQAGGQALLLPGRDQGVGEEGVRAGAPPGAVEVVLDGGGQGGGGVEAVGGLPSEGGQHELGQVVGDGPLGRPQPGVLDLPGDGRVEQGVHGVAHDGGDPREQLVQDGAQAEHIGGLAHLGPLAQGLLRGHVPGAAHHGAVAGGGDGEPIDGSAPVPGRERRDRRPRPGIGGGRGAAVGQVLEGGHPPVEDEDLTEPPDHDVRRLQVPVEDPHLVGERDGLAHLHEGPEEGRAGPPGRRGLVTFVQGVEHVPQGPPLDPLHDEPQAPRRVLPDLVHGHDVGVLELAGDLGFGLEPVGPAGLLGGDQDLDRHHAAQGGVPRLVDGGHPAPTQLALDHEAPQGRAGGEARVGPRPGSAEPDGGPVVPRRAHRRARPSSAGVLVSVPTEGAPLLGHLDPQGARRGAPAVGAPTPTGAGRTPAGSMQPDVPRPTKGKSNWRLSSGRTTWRGYLTQSRWLALPELQGPACRAPEQLPRCGSPLKGLATRTV